MRQAAIGVSWAMAPLWIERCTALAIFSRPSVCAKRTVDLRPSIPDALLSRVPLTLGFMHMQCIKRMQIHLATVDARELSRQWLQGYR
jgi:hypothetical protein